MTQPPTSALLEEIRKGSPKGMQTVFLQTRRYCVGTLIKKVQCTSDDAEDIYMDALIIFQENVLSGKLHTLSNLRTYLFGICYNLWRDLKRAEARWGKAQDEVARQYHLLLETDTEAELAAYAADMNRLKDVQHALESLGEKCKTLLRYVYMEQRSQQEIAELMGFANANVVKVTRHRCYKKWMEQLPQQG